MGLLFTLVEIDRIDPIDPVLNHLRWQVVGQPVISASLPNIVVPRKINMETDGMDLRKTIFLYNPVVVEFHVNLPGRIVLYKQQDLSW